MEKKNGRRRRKKKVRKDVIQTMREMNAQVIS